MALMARAGHGTAALFSPGVAFLVACLVMATFPDQMASSVLATAGAADSAGDKECGQHELHWSSALMWEANRAALWSLPCELIVQRVAHADGSVVPCLNRDEEDENDNGGSDPEAPHPSALTLLGIRHNVSSQG